MKTAHRWLNTGLALAALGLAIYYGTRDPLVIVPEPLIGEAVPLTLPNYWECAEKQPRLPAGVPPPPEGFCYAKEQPFIQDTAR